MRGYILAGGRSSRFGSDKALHVVDGEMLVVRTARVLAEAGLEPVVIARQGRHLPILELMEPSDRSNHPLWGVAMALSFGDDAFITPVDLPELSASTIRSLVEARAIAAGQPLLGVFPAELAARAIAFAEEDRPVYEFVAGLPTLDVGSILNLNR